MHDDGFKGHYLPISKCKRIETNLFFWSAVGKKERDNSGNIRESLVGWYGVYIKRFKDRPNVYHEEHYQGFTAAHLALALDILTTDENTLYVYGHQNNHHLSISGIIQTLVDNEWEIKDNLLHTNNPSCKMQHMRDRICFKDSFSYFPTHITELAVKTGLGLDAINDWEQTRDEYLYRAEQETKITAKAMLNLMWYIEDTKFAGIGNTGSGMGRSSLQKMEMFERPVIIEDKESIDWERESLYSGKQYTNYRGNLKPGYYYDLDIKAAHLTAFEHYRMPVKRLYKFPSYSKHMVKDLGGRYDIIADCIIRAHRNHYPCRTSEGNIHGLGTFKTRLCGPEIRDALEHGELVSIGEGYMYKMGTWSHAWARELRKRIEHAEMHDPLIHLALKPLSRSVSSSFAMRISRKVIDRVNVDPENLPFGMEEWGVPAGRKFEAMDTPNEWRADVDAKVNTKGYRIWDKHRMKFYLQDQNGRDAFPAILSFVQSHTRLALNKVIDIVGDGMIKCNTDGLNVDCKKMVKHIFGDPTLVARHKGDMRVLVQSAIDMINDQIKPFVLRLKHSFESGEVLSPNHIRMEEKRKYAGIPKDAVETSKNEFSFMQSDSFMQSVRDPHQYERIHREQNRSMQKLSNPGWTWADGSITPFKLYIDEEGNHQIEPPSPQDLLTKKLWPIESQHRIARKRLIAWGVEKMEYEVEEVGKFRHKNWEKIRDILIESWYTSRPDDRVEEEVIS